MKETLTVKRESLPVRCEVCHQTDLFNPETGTCARCNGVLEQVSNRTQVEESLAHWNVPPEFHEAVRRAVGDEAVLWMGRPGKMGFDKAAEYLGGNALLLFWVGLMCSGAMFLDDFGWGTQILWLFIAAHLFQYMIPSVFAYHRISRTFYVLTENRALAVRSDKPNDPRVFSASIESAGAIPVSEKDDVGIIAFEQRTSLMNRGRSWDTFVRFEAGVVQRYAQGFFYIENFRQVEDLVSDWFHRRRFEP
jgi:hypothetical protein